MVASIVADVPVSTAPKIKTSAIAAMATVFICKAAISNAPIPNAPAHLAMLTNHTHLGMEVMNDAPIVTTSLHDLTVAVPLVSAPFHGPILNAPAAFFDLKTKRALLQGLAC
jgi:hypothetical protein